MDSVTAFDERFGQLVCLALQPPNDGEGVFRDGHQHTAIRHTEEYMQEKKMDTVVYSQSR